MTSTSRRTATWVLVDADRDLSLSERIPARWAAGEARPGLSQEMAGPGVGGYPGAMVPRVPETGAPHFHFLLSLVLEQQGPTVIKRRTRKLDHRSDTYSTCQRVEDRASAAWYRIVGSGDEKHLRAGVCWEAVDEPDACLRYAAAHAAKPHQKAVPKEFQNVGRFWGKLGKVTIIEGNWEPMTAEQLFAEFGPDAMSSKGRVKKYLWDQS